MHHSLSALVFAAVAAQAFGVVIYGGGDDYGYGSNVYAPSYSSYGGYGYGSNLYTSSYPTYGGYVAAAPHTTYAAAVPAVHRTVVAAAPVVQRTVVAAAPVVAAPTYTTAYATPHYGLGYGSLYNYGSVLKK